MNDSQIPVIIIGAGIAGLTAAWHLQKMGIKRNKNNRIWLAGDYLGLPWTDSAAQTGLWAATQIHQYMNSK